MNNPITIEECRRELELEICPLCGGRRTVPVTIIDVTADFECPRCDGTGVRPVSELIDELRKTVQ